MTGGPWSNTETVWLHVAALPQASSACQVRVTVKSFPQSMLVCVFRAESVTPALTATNWAPKSADPRLLVCKLQPARSSCQYSRRALPATGGPKKLNPAKSFDDKPLNWTVQVKEDGKRPTSGCCTFT